MKKTIALILLIVVITLFSYSESANAYFSSEDYQTEFGKPYTYEDNRSIRVFNDFLNDFDIVFSPDLDYIFDDVDSTIMRFTVPDFRIDEGVILSHSEGFTNAGAYLSYVLTVIIDPFSSGNYFSYTPLFHSPYGGSEGGVNGVLNRIYLENGVIVENETWLSDGYINQSYYLMFVPCIEMEKTSWGDYYFYFDYNDLQISVNSILRQLSHILYNTPFMIVFDFDPNYYFYNFYTVGYTDGHEIRRRRRIGEASGAGGCIIDDTPYLFNEIEDQGTKVNFVPKFHDDIIDYNVRMNFPSAINEMLVYYDEAETLTYFDFNNKRYGIDNVHRFMGHSPDIYHALMENVGFLYIDGISQYTDLFVDIGLDIDIGGDIGDLFSFEPYPSYTFFTFSIPAFWQILQGGDWRDLPDVSWSFTVPKIWDLRILFNNALYYLEKVPIIKSIINPIYHITENVKLFFDDVLLEIFDITDGSDYIGIFIIGLLALTIVLRIIL